MAVLMILTVFAGFAPSFYLRSSFQADRQLSVLLHIHGVVFSAWIILFLVQSLLIAKGSRTLHQRLGWFTLAIAVIMLLLVGAATVEQMHRGLDEDVPSDLALNLAGAITFGIPVICAIYYRKRPDWHKRFMLCATLALLGAPILRLHSADDPCRIPNGHCLLLVLGCVFPAVFCLRSCHSRQNSPRLQLLFGAVHRCEIAMSKLPAWGPWLHFSRSLQQLVSTTG